MPVGQQCTPILPKVEAATMCEAPSAAGNHTAKGKALLLLEAQRLSRYREVWIDQAVPTFAKLLVEQSEVQIDQPNIATQELDVASYHL
jgi:hypothetical protein